MRSSYMLYQLRYAKSIDQWFIYPYKCYSSLSGAKNSKILSKFPPDKFNVWIIVPFSLFVRSTDKIKYVLSGDSWSTDIDDSVADAFYSWKRS